MTAALPWMNRRACLSAPLAVCFFLPWRVTSLTASFCPQGKLQPRKTAAKEKVRLPPSERQLLDTRDSKVLLSTNQLASLTGFKQKTIRRWVSRRLLNYIRVGNRFRFRAAAVELFLAQREVHK